MTGSVSFSQRVSVPNGVLRQVLEGESVILNVNTGRYFGLDPVGSRMWDHLTGAGTIEDAVQALLAEYEVEEAKLRSELAALIGELTDNGLIAIG